MTPFGLCQKSNFQRIPISKELLTVKLKKGNRKIIRFLDNSDVQGFQLFSGVGVGVENTRLDEGLAFLIVLLISTGCLQKFQKIVNSPEVIILVCKLIWRTLFSKE